MPVNLHDKLNNLILAIEHDAREIVHIASSSALTDANLQSISQLCDAIKRSRVEYGELNQ